MEALRRTRSVLPSSSPSLPLRGRQPSTHNNGVTGDSHQLGPARDGAEVTAVMAAVSVFPHKKKKKKKKRI